MSKFFTLHLKSGQTFETTSSLPQMPPGVYLEERKWTERPINDASSDVVAFVGYTEKATYSENIGFGDFNNVGIYDDSLVFRPVRISSFAEFTRVFGGEKVTLDNNYLYFNIKLFFENGGGECLVVSVRNNKDGLFADDLIKGLDSLKNDFHHSLLVIPEAACLPSLEDSLRVQRAMLRHCSDGGNTRFAILDIFGGFSSDGDPVNNFRNGIGDNSGYKDDADSDIYNKCLESGAAYYPWVKVFNEFSFKEVAIPASGGVAAQYLHQQWKVGIWKAPANISIKHLTNVCVDLAESEIVSITTPPDGKVSVNVIRKVPYSEPLIWGSRTLTKVNSIYRFINVKRTIDMIECSIRYSLTEHQYDENNPETWLRVEDRIKQYLESLRIRGALPGAMSQESYKVSAGPLKEIEALKKDKISSSEKIAVFVSVAVTLPGVFVELGE